MNIDRLAASAIYHQTNAQSLLGWFPWTGNSRQSVVGALRTLVDTGTKQYRDFVKKVIDVRSHSIHDPMKRNSRALLKHPRYKTTSKQGKKIETLQNNVAFCGQLHIVSVQKLYGDLAEFLAYEIQSFPHFLSNFGKFNLLAKHQVWLAGVSWAAWATIATFDSRQQSHGWCRYRTPSFTKR